ncbi:hypothetical protein MCEMSE15_00502 [Fimbriimonadaceae bacterium]
MNRSFGKHAGIRNDGKVSTPMPLLAVWPGEVDVAIVQS